MNKKVRTVAIICVACVFLVNIAVILIQFKALQKHSDMPQLTMKLRQENILLKEGFFHTYDFEGASVEYGLPVYDSDGNAVYLKDVLAGKNWLALFATAGAGSCRDCLWNNIEFIKSHKGNNNVIVCIEGLSEREFEIFVRQQGIEDIAYRIHHYSFPRLDINPVVYFVIDRQYECRYFYAPSLLLPDLVNDYFYIVSRKVALKR